jgi:hypothetical protein
MYAKLIDGQLVSPPNVCQRADGSTVIGYPTRPDLLSTDGYKRVVETAKPDGYFAAAWREEDESIVQVWTAYDPPAMPPPEPAPDMVPMVIESGIETPVLVLQSQSAGYGIGVIATDDGDIATYIDHQSPRPSADEIKARVQAAVIARKAEKTAYHALLDALAVGDAKAIKDAAKAAKEKARK